MVEDNIVAVVLMVSIAYIILMMMIMMMMVCELAIVFSLALSFYSNAIFIKQGAHRHTPGFLKLLLFGKSVCVFVCVCVRPLGY